MQYHTYRTYYDYMHRQMPDMFFGGDRDHYERSIRGALSNPGNLGPGEAASVAANQAFSEYDFICAGRPYFRFHPALISTFADSKMEDIEASMVKFPPGVKNAFSVQFPSPQDGNPLVLDKDHYLKAMLCHYSNEKSLDQLSGRVNSPTKIRRAEGDENRLIVWMDIGETAEMTIQVKNDLLGHPTLYGTRYPQSDKRVVVEPIYTYRQLAYDKGDSIEEAMWRLPHAANMEIGVSIPPEFVKRVIRLMLSICFLTEANDELIQFEPLNKDRRKIKDASPDRLLELQERARRRGKLGFTVGTDDMFRPQTTLRPLEGDSERQLSYSHIRSGHWHTVLHGPQRSLRKVVWFRPVRVRPDLNFRA